MRYFDKYCHLKFTKQSDRPYHFQPTVSKHVSPNPKGMSIQTFLLFLLVSFSKPSAESIKYLGETQTGIASYYSTNADGHSTYYGEIFDSQELTAAHPSLPYNTLIEVTNLTNNKKVTVRINDRGPHIKSRIVDLSKSAARELGMVASGVAKVVVKVIGVDGLFIPASSEKKEDTSLH